MIHHRQRLPLRLEPRDDLLGVHPQLDDLERHAPPHRLGLLRDIDHAAPAFADPLQQLVAPERLADGFVGRIGEIELEVFGRSVSDARSSDSSSGRSVMNASASADTASICSTRARSSWSSAQALVR